MYNPDENIIEHSFCKFAGLSLLSASLPPIWYPAVRAAKMMPISTPQVFIELPKIGVNSLLAANSSAIATKPEMKTSAAKIQGASSLDFS